ncbi:MAG: imidazoleglycerol-phosphate dehydratase HisB [Deltaproteobacteria bacterium]|nr:imidazoleglycerol-phosphate dehydratase HisB [Deltaproteobacteria bacterium]
MRTHTLERKTKETDISLHLELDGDGQNSIRTGFGLADHMLDLMAYWAGFNLRLNCSGDLHVDAHHTLEDVGLSLGTALKEALGDRKGIGRVGWARVPMDEALVEATVDLSGRPYLVYREDCLPEVIAGEEKDVWREFFKALTTTAGMNVHLDFRYGMNGHHLLESSFKGLGLALRQAVARVERGVFSTKGVLQA